MTLQLALDPALQLWVMLPITLATLLMAQLRRNLSALVGQRGTKPIWKEREARMLQRAKTVRQNRGYISAAQYEARRLEFVRENGLLDKNSVGSRSSERSILGAMAHPDALANQAVTLALTVVPQMLLGQWASASFQGLVVCRLPFTLTPRFRSMLQSGVEHAVQNLDVSYVSSLSWYILNLFGNAALLSLFAPSNVNSPTDSVIPNITSQLSFTMSPQKIFNAEREALVSANHENKLSDQHEVFLSTNPSQFAPE